MKSRIGRRRAAALADGAEAYAERRQAVIQAAAVVFGEKGFSGATLADIADSLQMDRASLYYYIASKDEAFHEIVRDAAETNAVQAETIRDRSGTAPDKLRRLITALMVSYAEHPFLLVYIQEDLTRAMKGKTARAREMQQIHRRYDEAVVGIIEAGFADKSLRPVASARLLANAIIGMVNWSHRWYRAKTPGMPPPADIGDAFADAILGGVAAHAKGRAGRGAGAS